MRFRPIPSIPGFENRAVVSQYATGLQCCWDLGCKGGKVKDVVAWLRANRPHFKTRVTAVLRTHHSTWVVDVCEENVRVTHFRRYDLWMSERMKLWWRERKAKAETMVNSDADADREVQRRLHIMRQIGHMWPIVDLDSDQRGQT